METSIDPATDGVLADVALQCGVRVYHAELRGHTLRVEIDAGNGVTVDTCARFARALGTGLKLHGTAYSGWPLEVSSPGVERRLYRPADYAAALGRNVCVTTAAGVLEGRLDSADESGFTVAGDPPAPARHVAYSEVRVAHVKATDSELFGRSNRREPKE
jgi:ribosome maturation factor RimP